MDTLTQICTLYVETFDTATNVIKNSNLKNILISIVTGIISGAITTIVVISIQKFVRIISYKRDYKNFEGTYEGYEKYDELTESPRVILSLKLLRKKNKFIITDGKILINKEYPDITGEILMDETLHNFGKGYYHQLNAPGYGFFDVQLKAYKNEKKILVNATYINKFHKEEHRCWIWKKIN